jgi:hypothetical protein
MIREFILSILGFIIVFFFVYSSVNYWELKDTIKHCNQDFGIGNWTFTEDHNFYIDSFSCRAYHQDSYVTSSATQYITTTKTCFKNGKEVTC